MEFDTKTRMLIPAVSFILLPSIPAPKVAHLLTMMIQLATQPATRPPSDGLLLARDGL